MYRCADVFVCAFVCAARRQLVAAVAVGRVAAARRFAGRVVDLYGCGLGRQSGLRSAAAAALARLHLLTERWPEVSAQISQLYAVSRSVSVI